MVGITQQKHYKAYEMDFGRRMIAKFRFNPKSFWLDRDFPRITSDALYPKGRDWLEQLTAEITQTISATSA
jgi:hypothetical protein